MQSHYQIFKLKSCGKQLLPSDHTLELAITDLKKCFAMVKNISVKEEKSQVCKKIF